MDGSIGTIPQNQPVNTFQQTGNTYQGPNNYQPYSTQPAVQSSSNMGYYPNQFVPPKNLAMLKGQYAVMQGSHTPPMQSG